MVVFPGKTCQSNLLSMLNFFRDAIEHNLEVYLVYFDFSKKFDSVPHQKLIHNFDQYGISGQLLLWIKDFLSNKRQQVHVSSALSDWALVISGILQVRVFGPILFILSTNNLPRHISKSISICRRHKASSSIISFPPRAAK